MNEIQVIDSKSSTTMPQQESAGVFHTVEERTVITHQRIAWSDAAPWWLAGIALAAATATGVQVFFATDGTGRAGVFIPVCCFMLCALGAWVDSATRRIPNVLTYPAILLGLGMNAILVPTLAAMQATAALAWVGSPGPRESLLGFLLCAAVGILGFMSRGLGGGDVKLLAAVGDLIGLAAVVPVLLNTLLIAAAIGIVNWILRGEMIARLQVVTLGVMQSLATRRGYAKVYPFRRSEAPFGLSLLLGLVSAQFIATHEIVMQLLRW